MNKLGLRRQILFLTITPAIFIAMAFVAWFSWVQLGTLEDSLRSRARSASERLTDAAEYGLLVGNQPLLQAIARTTLNEPDARSISIYNDRLEVMAQVGPAMKPVSEPTTFSRRPQIYEGPGTIRFRIPVKADKANLYNNLPAKARSENIGWIEIEFSNASIRIEQYKNLLINMGLFICAIVIATFAGLVATRGVITPIRYLLEVVEQIRDGNLDIRLAEYGEGEVRDLADGINAMADSLQNAQREMQSNIDQATQDLRETLETIEIQNIELDMARREALEASRIKSEFLANMSHEIRTPLNGILGFTKLLLKSSLHPKQEEYAKTIHSSSESLLSIINDVLDFAKIEAGKMILDNRNMNLHETIEDVLTMLAPSAHVRHLELISLIYSDVPAFVVSDQLRIKQVLTNLVNNAIKFTEKGSVTIRVALENTRNDQVIIRLSVTDTGIGLSKDQQKALFKAFQQADSSTAREYGGTGLGLVISKRLVEQMGGDIGLESEQEKGSTFWFTIRAEPGKYAGNQVPASVLRGSTVVIMDPHELVRLSLKHTLSQWGINTADVESSAQLFSTLEKNDIRTVVFGLPPCFRGDEHLIKDLSRLKEEFNCNTILLMPSVEESERTKAIEKLVKASLTKPVRSKQLLDTLEQINRKRVSQPALPQPAIEPEPEKPSDPNHIRVLAVDDNSANLRLLTALLQDLGMEVFAAESGKEALDLTENHRFDLAFMDIQMPHMDGIETTERIRSGEQEGQHLPIIALTAHALAGEKENLLHRGLDDYLTKPIDESLLAVTIRKWTGLDVSQSASGTETETPALSETGNRPASGTRRTETPDGDMSDFSALPSVDLIIGLDRAAGKANLARDMMEMLLAELGRTTQQISHYYDSKDYASLLETIHKLHGGCHYCGVVRLQKLAFETESALKRKRYEIIEDLLMLLYEEISELRRWQEKTDISQAFLEAQKLYAIKKKLNRS